MEAHPAVLDRALAVADAEPIRTKVLEAMEEVVNYGTWVLVRCQASAQGGPDADIAPVSIYRHVLEQCDGIASLCAAGAPEAAVPNIRSMYEGWLSLQHLFENSDNYRQRSLAWFVTFEAKRREEYVLLDPETPQGARTVAQLKTGWGTQSVVLPDPSQVRAAIQNLDEMFKHEHLSPVKAEYDRTLKGNGNRPIRWHSLFNGPKSIRQLAERLGHGAAYASLYAHWSTVGHATDGPGWLMRVGDSAALRRLRLPDELKSAACMATQTTVDCTRLLLAHFRSGETGFQDWYTGSIRPKILALGCLRQTTPAQSASGDPAAIELA